MYIYNIYIYVQYSQKIGTRKGVSFLFIMFTPRVMVIKMLKWLIFLFSPDDRRKIATVLVKNLNTSERSPLALLKNAMDY